MLFISIILTFIKAFTFWVNQYLSEDKVVNDIANDFKDGIRLIALFESLTKARMTSKYIKSPKNRVHFIENIHLALMFLKKESEFDTSNYGTEGLYSTLIYNFSLLIRLFS